MIDHATPMHRRRFLRRLAAILCALILGAAVTTDAIAGTGSISAASATPPPRFAVQPWGPTPETARSWFVYTLNPGQVYYDRVVVSNLTKRNIDLLIYPKDAVNVPNGGFGLQEDPVKPTELGSWIHLALTRITLKAGKQAVIPFIVIVPKNGEPGDHAAAILATDADQAKAPFAGKSGRSFNLRTRIGARMYVRVTGLVRPQLSVTRLDVKNHTSWNIFNGGYARVTWMVKNTGNVRLTPTVQLSVKTIFGIKVKSLRRETLPELLPGGTYQKTELVKGLPSLAWLSASLRVTAPGVRISRAKGFWSLNLWVLLIIALLIVGWYLNHRRRKNTRAKQATVSRLEPRAA